ncbi:MAG: hypothetical protein P4L53_06715 [Candidatus Obscuribacterales bacterium]|nr:hypothetical protein [Candidatus Obscuribacterales bacterium]
MARIGHSVSITASVAVMAGVLVALLTVLPCQAQPASPYQTNPSNVTDWCNSVKDIAPFTQPADGTVCGQPFKVYNAKFVSSANNFEFDDLLISSEGNAQKIEIKFDTGYSLDDLQGKTLTFTPQISSNMPVVKVSCANGGNSEMFNSVTGFGLKMMFGTYDHGAISCKIIMRLPGPQRTHLQGAFAIAM